MAGETNIYLDLGGTAAVYTKDIIGIFDLDNTSWSVHTRKYLSSAERSGCLINAADDLPKSFTVLGDDTVILAQPNTAVLIKRLENREKVNV